MQKGYKRNAKGKAILHCFIGLFIVIIVILVAYFCLNIDYSDKLDPNASMRPYVEMTPAPSANASAAPSASALPDATPVPSPTVEPTATPTPSPAPTETPAPTSMASLAAPVKRDGFALPPETTMDVKMGITHSFRSTADSYRYVYLEGYAYVDDPGFDGSVNAQYLVVTQVSSNASILVLPTKTEGISGLDHADAKCANASASDFQVVIDASSFPDEIYSLGMVFQYTDANGQGHLEYAKFPDNQTITVLSSQIISEIPVTEAE